MSMTREFIRTNEFEKCWKQLDLCEQDLIELESHLCMYPESGDIIQGTGGLRKLRWALPNKGKSGGVRIVYVDFAYYERIYFISAYAKSDKINLTHEERNQIRKFIKILSDELGR